MRSSLVVSLVHHVSRYIGLVRIWKGQQWRRGQTRKGASTLQYGVRSKENLKGMQNNRRHSTFLSTGTRPRRDVWLTVLFETVQAPDQRISLCFHRFREIHTKQRSTRLVYRNESNSVWGTKSTKYTYR